MKTPEPVPVLAPWLRTAIGLALLVLTAMFAEPLIGLLPPGLGLQAWLEPLRNAAIALAMFAGAHLVHSLVAARLAQRRKGQRPVPKVLLDLFRVFLFALALLGALSLLFRQDLSGILTGSGLVLAVLGFAIRNVVADTLSGIALGIEAPFRMGDWVRIETLAQGRVQARAQATRWQGLWCGRRDWREPVDWWARRPLPEGNCTLLASWSEAPELLWQRLATQGRWLRLPL